MNAFTTCCPCCLNPVLISLTVITISLFYLCTTLSKKSIILRVISYTLMVISVLLCGITGGLLYSKEFSRFAFAKVFTMLSSKTFMDEMRCADIKSIGGNVLEIGPGAGGNFRCWENSTTIDAWTAIEVNQHFATPLLSEYRKRNLSFSTRINWIQEDGSGIDIVPSSYDYVVLTHVLCSVPDITPVLETVARALKPGGTFYFLEHVATLPGDRDYDSLQLWQQVVGPLLTVFGAGCQLKDTEFLLRQATQFGPLSGYDSNITRFVADIMPLPMRPHIRGTVTRPV